MNNLGCANIKSTMDQHAIIAVTDLRGRVTYVNEAFCALSGYAAAELVGKDLRLLNSGYHPQRFFQALYQQISQGLVWQGEMCNRAQDGRVYWVDTTICPLLGDARQVIGYLALGVDISGQKQAEMRAFAEQQAKAVCWQVVSQQVQVPLVEMIQLTQQVLQDELLPEQRASLSQVLEIANAVSSELQQWLALAQGASAAPTKVVTEDTEISRAAEPTSVVKADFKQLAAPIKGATVLLVDDDECSLLIAKELLTIAGLEVLPAHSGAEALQWLQERTVAAVLLDLNMPMLSGLETTQQIRLMTQGQPLPIIALSGANSAQELAEALRAGMNDYLAKPVMPLALIHCLLKWIPAGISAPSVAVVEVHGADAWFQQQLLAFPNLNAELALERLHGNWSLLADLLKLFAEQYADVSEQIAAAIASGNISKATGLLHRIKGSAKNLGILELPAYAACLEANLLNNEDHSMAQQDFEQCLHTILNHIANYLS